MPPVITPAVLADMQAAFNALFNEGLAGARSFYDRLAMVVPSAHRSETYGWMKALPKVREWLGDRFLNRLAAHGYRITNKDFELTVEVDRNDILDDSLGVYSPVFTELGRATKVNPDELLFALAILGFTAECYDGQNFFDTDHPVGDTVQSNSGGGAGDPWMLLDVSRAIKPFVFQRRQAPQFTAMDQPGDENVFMRKTYRYGVDERCNVGFGLWQLAYGSKQTLDATAYAAARAAMGAYTDDGGKKLAIDPRLLVVGPGNEEAGREILNAERNAAGATNVWKGTAELLVVPYL